MASMAQPFAHPGAMPGHGGMPHGHPMGPHPGNQGVPGGQNAVSMANQMHGMVGGPQAGQGPVMGMPQGGGPAGPNAHAMSHLNPNLHNQQMYQQQQQIQQASKYIVHPELYWWTCVLGAFCVSGDFVLSSPPLLLVAVPACVITQYALLPALLPLSLSMTND